MRREAGIDAPHQPAALRPRAALLDGVSNDHSRRTDQPERAGQQRAVHIVRIGREVPAPHRAPAREQHLGRLGPVAAQPLPRFPVDPVEAVNHRRRQHAAVGEDGVAHDHDDVPPRQPQGDRSTRRQRRAARTLALGEDRQLCPPQVEAAQAAKRRKPAGSHVPHVALDVEELVIAVQYVHGATGSCRRLAQALEQVEDLELAFSAIELVAGLHHDELAANPPVAGVDRAAEPERPPGRLEVAVEVADRNQARRSGLAQRRDAVRLRSPAAEQTGDDQRGEHLQCSHRCLAKSNRTRTAPVPCASPRVVPTRGSDHRTRVRANGFMVAACVRRRYPRDAGLRALDNPRS